MKKMKILFFFCLLCIVASIHSVAQEVRPDEATGEQIYILKDGYTLIFTNVLEHGNHVYKVFLKKGNEMKSFLFLPGSILIMRSIFLAMRASILTIVLCLRSLWEIIIMFYMIKIRMFRYWIFIWADMIYQIICLFIGKKKAVYRGTLPLHVCFCLICKIKESIN